MRQIGTIKNLVVLHAISQVMANDELLKQVFGRLLSEKIFHC